MAAGRHANRLPARRPAPAHVINSDGTGETRLTNHHEQSPSWSPDGSRIAFCTFRHGDAESYVMNADGSEPTNLTNRSSANDCNPTWSPDGTRIAFDSDRDGNIEIYAMNADGTGPIRLTNSPSHDFTPAWSPDGSKIAFKSFRDGNDEIYVMNADGSGQVNVSNNSARDWYPAWGPPVDVDADDDGIADDVDQCLGTPPGQAVGPDGCTIQADSVPPTLTVPPILVVRCAELGADGRGCVTATDHSVTGWLAQATARVQVVYDFEGFLAPLLKNGSASIQQGRQGRTIPVKFQLRCANGAAVSTAVAAIAVFQVLNVDTGTVDTTDLTADAGEANNDGVMFRYDAGSQQYVYNLSTAGWSAPATYQIVATLDDGTQQTVMFSLR